MLGSARGEAMRAAQRCEDVAVPLVAWGGENPRVPNAEKRPVGRFFRRVAEFYNAVCCRVEERRRRATVCAW